MQRCSYCGAEYADDVIECPIDRNRLGTIVCSSQGWLSQTIKYFRSQTLKRKLQIIGFCSVAFVVIFVLSTARYSYNSRVFQISKPPFFQISLAPAERWIVRKGINIVLDHDPGMVGNLAEFPICPGYRAGVTVFSWRWWQSQHGTASCIVCRTNR